jgi:thiaminase/transcriptional activator TenA
MSSKSFYEQIRGKTDRLWQATFSHPFVSGIGDGSLSRQRYEFFLKQDYLYLTEFSRVFALGTTKAKNLRDMTYFADLLQGTLKTEMELHRRTCKAFGIALEDLEKTEPALITTAYTNHLVRTCYEGSFSDILAVLLPCGSGYIEIGQHLKVQGLPENKFYQDWINTYTSKEFVEVAEWLEARMNVIAAASCEEDRIRWYRLYLTSARFEYLFFDMCWNKQVWPENIIA